MFTWGGVFGLFPHFITEIRNLPLTFIIVRLCKAGTNLRRVWSEVIEYASVSNFKTDIHMVYVDVILFLKPVYTPTSATELICALNVHNTT